MQKGADAFRSIGEVAKMVGVAPHVLRYWETQFALLKPVKRRDGRRYYRPDDVRLAAGLCEVLREEGLTIRGAKKLLASDRGETVRARGAKRLGDVLGGAEDQTASDAQSAAKPPPAPEPSVKAEPAAPAPTAKPAATAPSPKSRTRRRPAAQPESLPLFPDLQPATPRIDWLAHLVATAQALRAHPTGSPLPRKAHMQACRLRDAIDAHY